MHNRIKYSTHHYDNDTCSIYFHTNRIPHTAYHIPPRRKQLESDARPRIRKRPRKQGPGDIPDFDLPWGVKPVQSQEPLHRCRNLGPRMGCDSSRLDSHAVQQQEAQKHRSTNQDCTPARKRLESSAAPNRCDTRPIEGHTVPQVPKRRV